MYISTTGSTLIIGIEFGMGSFWVDIYKITITQKTIEYQKLDTYLIQ
jgi:hypothetical protein